MSNGSGNFAYASGAPLGSGLPDPPTVQNVWPKAIPNHAPNLAGNSTITGNKLYFDNFEKPGGIYGVDISDPANPTFFLEEFLPSSDSEMVGMSTFESGGNKYLICIDTHGENVFGGPFQDHLLIYEIGSDGTLTEVYRSYTGDTYPDLNFDFDGKLSFYDPVVVGDVLITLSGHSGYFTFDISDPTNPVYTDFYPDSTLGYGDSVQTMVTGDYLWVSADHHALGIGTEFQCFYVQDADHVISMGQQIFPAPASLVGANGKKAYNPETGMIALANAASAGYSDYNDMSNFRDQAHITLVQVNI